MTCFSMHVVPPALPQRSEPNRPAFDHVERLLDHALEDTFPASDPISLSRCD
ncbi:MAG TPA: hypothetical protein VM689_11210 [Aliidongia sp.]|nr:hypothetical protein [Aliidongia sp.]